MGGGARHHQSHRQHALRLHADVQLRGLAGDREIPPEAVADQVLRADQARIKTGGAVFSEPFNVLIDPRVAADGVTQADLQEQFEHNVCMREMVSAVNQLMTRVRQAQNTSGNDLETAKRLTAIASKLMTEPVRYGKPGLQAHITYLAGMTANVDQKIGRDAIERYEVLKKELNVIRAEVDQLLGPASTTSTNGARQEP